MFMLEEQMVSTYKKATRKASGEKKKTTDNGD